MFPIKRRYSIRETLFLTLLNVIAVKRHRLSWVENELGSLERIGHLQKDLLLIVDAAREGLTCLQLQHQASLLR